ncbi:MAG: hypothetical protein U9Q81_26185 [Pseudomonadota bacterium]|nr:hypothetical protein [Pseudomonadota bacterium]
MSDILRNLSYIVVILGIPTFFLDQYEGRQRQNKLNTLEYVNRFHDPHLIRQRFALLRPWLDRDLNKLLAAGASRRTLQDLVLADVTASAEKGREADMRAALFDVVDFYDSLSVCLQVSLCSSDLAESYFGDYATRFFCLYEGYIKKVRTEQSIPSFGLRLEEFSNSIKACYEETRGHNVADPDHENALSSSWQGAGSSPLRDR